MPHESILVGRERLPVATKPRSGTSGAILLDWDGALRRGFLISDWAQFLASRKLFNTEVLRLLLQELTFFYEGKAAYDHIVVSIPTLYALGLEGQDVDAHEAIADEYIKSADFLDAITRPACYIFDLIGALPNVASYIISGGPGSVLAPFARKVGITEVYAVESEIQNGVFTGLLVDNPATLDRKKELVSLVRTRQFILLAAGDSESDRPMLDAAQYRVTFGNELAHAWACDPNTLTLHHLVGAKDLAALSSFLVGVSKTWNG